MEPDLLTQSELARVFTDGVRARSAARGPLSRQVALASPIEQALRAFDMYKWTPVTSTIVSDELGDRMSLLHGAPAFLKQRAADARLTQLVKAQVLGLGLRVDEELRGDGPWFWPFAALASMKGRSRISWRHWSCSGTAKCRQARS